MPDRELTEEETKKFVHEHVSGDIFHALEVFGKEKTKPTLHDLCLIELEAAVEGMKHVMIEYGHEVKALREELGKSLKDTVEQVKVTGNLIDCFNALVDELIIEAKERKDLYTARQLEKLKFNA